MFRIGAMLRFFLIIHTDYFSFFSLFLGYIDDILQLTRSDKRCIGCRVTSIFLHLQNIGSIFVLNFSLFFL